MHPEFSRLKTPTLCAAYAALSIAGISLLGSQVYLDPTFENAALSRNGRGLLGLLPNHPRTPLGQSSPQHFTLFLLYRSSLALRLRHLHTTLHHPRRIHAYQSRVQQSKYERATRSFPIA